MPTQRFGQSCCAADTTLLSPRLIQPEPSRHSTETLHTVVHDERRHSLMASAMMRRPQSVMSTGAASSSLFSPATDVLQIDRPSIAGSSFDECSSASTSVCSGTTGRPDRHRTESSAAAAAIAPAGSGHPNSAAALVDGAGVRWITPAGSRFNTTDITAGGTSPQPVASLGLAPRTSQNRSSSDTDPCTVGSGNNKSQYTVSHRVTTAIQIKASSADGATAGTHLSERGVDGFPRPPDPRISRGASQAGEGRWNWADLRGSRGGRRGTTSREESARRSSVPLNGTQEWLQERANDAADEPAGPTSQQGEGNHLVSHSQSGPKLQPQQQGSEAGSQLQDAHVQPAATAAEPPPTAVQPDRTDRRPGSAVAVELGRGRTSEEVIHHMGSATLVSSYDAPPWRQAHNVKAAAQSQRCPGSNTGTHEQPHVDLPNTQGSKQGPPMQGAPFGQSGHVSGKSADVLDVTGSMQLSKAGVPLQGWVAGMTSRQQAKEERWRRQLATPTELWSSIEARCPTSHYSISWKCLLIHNSNVSLIRCSL